jgi:diadenosine tetraphosphatase ApaH/serine/threonine PP2A family protein phosphatase
MRVAVVSDIHSNLHALEAALTAIEAEAPDELWCLGDLVGYGARPNECCAAIAERADLCLAGNHDLVVLGTLDMADFAGEAAAAAQWTRDVLDEDARAFLAPLEPQAKREGVALYHGSARDPVWEYVLSSEAAWWTFQAATEPLVLVGHSHVPLTISLDGDALNGGVADDGVEVELSDKRWLLNPGSVGQPRQGDPRAAYLLLDLDAQRATFRRAEYDVERSQREIREAGLPELLAARLPLGQ